MYQTVLESTTTPIPSSASLSHIFPMLYTRLFPVFQVMYRVYDSFRCKQSAYSSLGIALRRVPHAMREKYVQVTYASLLLIRISRLIHKIQGQFDTLR